MADNIIEMQNPNDGEYAEIEMQIQVGDEISAAKAEAYAVGERNGVPVTAGDPTYHNNAKYYAEQAGNSATASAGSATAAAGSASDASGYATAASTAKDAAETAASNAETAISHYPKIQNGTWWVWNPSTSAWVNTNVQATGEWRIVKTYASIAAMNADYSGTDVKVGEFVMVVSTVEDPDNAKLYVKGSSAWQFIVDMSGATGIQGPKGDTGTGIASVVLNSNYTLTINLDDGTSYTTGSIRGAKGSTGEKGDKGDTGTGIASIAYNQDYTLTVTLDDGTSYTTDPIRGAKGDTGTGIASVVLNQDYTLTISMDDGTSYTTSSIRGAQGEQGIQGPTGATPSFSIGTVTDLPAGSTPTASITGTAENPVLNLGLVHGQSGNETIDDTAGIGDTDLVYSADKVRKELDKKADVIGVDVNTPDAVVSFSDGADGMPMGLMVSIKPVQDLHGQEYPWPAGGGKNLIPMTLENIKSKNTSGTWNENIYTYRGVSYTVNTDGGGNVTSIGVNGTASNASKLAFGEYSDFASGSYTLTGCPAGGDYSSTYSLYVYSVSTQSTVFSDSGSGGSGSLTNGTEYGISILVRSGASVSNIIFHPMLRLSSITDSTFAPYSNICPISGWMSARILQSGEDLIPYGTDTSNGFVDNNYLRNTGALSANNDYFVSEYIEVEPGAVYTYGYIKTDPDAVNPSAPSICFYDSSKTYISSSGVNFNNRDAIDVTAPATAAYARVSVRKIALQMFFSRKEDYHPAIYDVTFPTEAGTVYGGTLTINKDGTGSLVPKFVYMDITNTNFIALGYAGGFRFRVADNTGMIGPLGRNAFITSTHWKGVAEPDPIITDYTKPWIFCASNIQIVISTGDQSLDTVAKLQAYLTAQSQAGTPACICYQTADQTPIPLTAPQVLSLLGVNNIFADTGDILSVDYAADTKMYIKKAVTSPADDMTAQANIPNNTYFTVGNHLYLSTAAIVQGDEIQPGTNCTETPIADMFNTTTAQLADGISMTKYGRVVTIKCYLYTYDSGSQIGNIPPTVNSLMSVLAANGYTKYTMNQPLIVDGQIGYIAFVYGEYVIKLLNGSEASGTAGVLGTLRFTI